MRTENIDTFFSNLSEKLITPSTVIITGGAAALLLGGSRPTLDIDFCIITQASNQEIEQAIQYAQKESQIRTHYSEDINSWSNLSLLDYKDHTRPYKTFGNIKVEILEPEYWSIGKMSLYYDSDIEDMINVFREQKTEPYRLSQIWNKSLQQSPRSNSLIHFKKHTRHFLENYGSTIWGNEFDGKSMADQIISD